MTVSTPTRSDRKLSEVARHLVVPAGIETSQFPRVYHRLQDVGVSFDRWQQGFGQVALGCRASGKYAATIGGVVASWPRQVGKTYTVGNMLIGLCLEHPGLRAIWTSHHNRTTTNTFRSMQGMVRRKKIWPHVAANGIRTANGEQEIRFANGSIIMFGAREQGFGRGMDAIDVLVFDEAQILGLKALEDMVPATNAAANPHGGLVLFIGTPPRPNDDGEAFTAKRSRALDGQTADQVYCEISAEPDTDPDDQSKFGTFNPSYPHRTPLESMLRMRENIPDDDAWRREAMGIWPEVSRHEPIVKAGVWKLLAATGPDSSAAPNALGVDMSHGGDLSVGGCWIRDTSAHIEEVWSGSNLAAAIDFIVRAAGRRIEVVIDDVSPAAQLIPELKARGVRVRRTGPRDMSKACGLLVSRATAEPDGEAKALTHGDQSSVTNALAGAVKRAIGDAGGWGYDRRDASVSIYPIVAVTLALLGATADDRRHRGGATFV